MQNDMRKLQSHMAMLHREMQMVGKFLDERNALITQMNEKIGELLIECDVLQSELESTRFECESIEQQVELVQADRDTLIAGLAPLLRYRKLEIETTPARLIAVLLLSTDDRAYAWHLIERAAKHAEQVDTLAARLLTLLEHEDTQPPVNEATPETHPCVALTAPINDADLQIALDAMRATYDARKHHKSRKQRPSLS
jgi:chromosome segregation ATPase